ncbi:hypothetical protein EJ06DRAFT_513418 [Trichodelitschia bisporula]|uniref:Transcription factor TFIIIC complex subunit Tfc6 n=1 Tax=Trichodelitschia bisporula TaxID=703511 RepID=A0A6G1HRE1_9PEZI|nr:hypothetical protein EJ06DRAFT_513418 [Trichodelitschia bisporula]
MPPRRPVRERKANNYAANQFADLDAILGEVADISDGVSIEEEYDDEDFAVTAIAEEEADPDDEVLSEVAPTDEEEGGEGEADEQLGDISIAGSEDEAEGGAGTGRPSRVGRPERQREVKDIGKLPIFDERGSRPLTGRDYQYTRGIPEVHHMGGKETRLLYSIGPGTEDVIAHIKDRDIWDLEPALPTRQPQTDGTNGLSYSHFYPEEKRKKEVEEGWKWFDAVGCQAFSEHQSIVKLSPDEGEKLLPFSRAPEMAFIEGPIGEQKLFHLAPNSSVNIKEAWSTDPKARRGTEAWVINCGAEITSLQWIPNQPGLSQYLCVVVNPKEYDEPEERDYENSLGFVPNKAFRTCAQIWEFKRLPCPEGQGSRPDYTHPPVLRFVLSWDWGEVRWIKWCPVPRKLDTELQDGAIHLGLMGGVWADGKLRVLEVAITPDLTSPITYQHYSAAAFEARPPNTIITCLTWISPTQIGAGTAIGTVGIWDLERALAAKPTTANPIPWFYHTVQTSFILNISASYPSRPTFLTTLGIDGHTRLTNILHPTCDSAYAPRVRVAQRPLAWHDVCQCSLSTEENFDLRAHLLRLFWRTGMLARFGGLATDIAVSPVHPFVLASTVDGTVFAMNPMRRIREHKTRSWQQMWFSAEWRRGVGELAYEADADGDVEMRDDADDPPAAEPSPATANSHNQPDPASTHGAPLVRFMLGYKLQKSILDQDSRPNNTKEGVLFTTVHEPKTAVTQVDWNPNLCCGTWAAAGMGSGLLRVEDIGLD